MQSTLEQASQQQLSKQKEYQEDSIQILGVIDRQESAREEGSCVVFSDQNQLSSQRLRL